MILRILLAFTLFFTNVNVYAEELRDTQCVPFGDAPEPELDAAQLEAQEIALQINAAKIEACKNDDGSFKRDVIQFPPGPRTEDTEDVSCEALAEEAYKIAVRNNCSIDRAGLIRCLTNSWDIRDAFDFYENIEEVDQALPQGDDVDPFASKLGMKLDEHFACPGKEEPADAIYKAISCSLISSAISIAPLGSFMADQLINTMVPASARPSARECVDTDNSCLTQVVWGAIQNVFTNIQGLYELGRLAVEGIGNGLRAGWDYIVGNDNANDAAADQAAVAARLENDIQNNEEAQQATGNWASRLVDSIVESAHDGMFNQFSCTKWEGGVSSGDVGGALATRIMNGVGGSGMARCTEAAPNWECASGKQKFQMICGVAGFIGGEVITTILTGGTVRALSLTGRLASRAAANGSRVARATVAVGRGAQGVGRGVLSTVGAGISLVMTAGSATARATGGLAMKIGDRILPMSANMQARFAAQQLGRGLRGVGRGLLFPLQVLDKAYDIGRYGSLDRAYMLGRYGNDGATALRGLANTTDPRKIEEAIEAGFRSRNLERTSRLPDEDSFLSTELGTQVRRELQAAQEALQQAERNFLEASQLARRGSNGPNAQALIDQADEAYRAWQAAKNQLGPMDEAYTVALGQHQARVAEEARLAVLSDSSPIVLRSTATAPTTPVVPVAPVVAAARTGTQRTVSFVDSTGTTRLRNVSEEAISNSNLDDVARAAALRRDFPNLSDSQIQGVIRNHNGVDEAGNALRAIDPSTGRSVSLACPVGTCTSPQLRAKLQNLTDIGIPNNVARDIIRRGYAGQPNSTFATSADGLFSARPANFDQYSVNRRNLVELHPDHPNAASTQALQGIDDVTGSTQVRLRVQRTNPDGSTQSGELFGYFRGSDRNGQVLYFENSNGIIAINPNDPSLAIRSIDIAENRVVDRLVRIDGYRPIYDVDRMRVLNNNLGNNVEVRYRFEDGEVMSTSGEIVMHEGRLQLRKANQYNGSQYIYSRLDDLEIESISRIYPSASWRIGQTHVDELENLFEVGARVQVNYQKPISSFNRNLQDATISGEYMGLVREVDGFSVAIRLDDGVIEYVPLTSQAQANITARAATEEIANFTSTPRPARVETDLGPQRVVQYTDSSGRLRMRNISEEAIANAELDDVARAAALRRQYPNLTDDQINGVIRNHNGVDAAGNAVTVSDRVNGTSYSLSCPVGTCNSVQLRAKLQNLTDPNGLNIPRDVAASILRRGFAGQPNPALANGGGILSSLTNRVRSIFGGGGGRAREVIPPGDPRNIRAGDWQARTGREDGMYNTHSGSIDQLVKNDVRFRGGPPGPDNPYNTVDRRFWWIDNQIRNSRSPIVREVGGHENLRRTVYWPTGFDRSRSGLDQYFLDNEAHRLVVNQTRNANGEWVDHSLEVIARDADGNFVPLLYTKEGDRWVYTEQFRGGTIHDRKTGCIACHNHPSAPDVFTPIPYNVLGRNRPGVKGSAVNDHTSRRFDENVSANISAIYGDGPAPRPQRFAVEPVSALNQEQTLQAHRIMEAANLNKGLGLRIAPATTPEMVETAANLPMIARQYAFQRRASITVTSDDMVDIERAHNAATREEREAILREIFSRHEVTGGDRYIDNIINELTSSGIIGPP